MSQAFTKIHEKNQIMYFGQQNAQGTPVPDACFAEVTLNGTLATLDTIVFGTTNTLTLTVTGASASLAAVIAALVAYSATGLTSGSLGASTTYAITTAGTFTTGGPNNSNIYTFTSVLNQANMLAIRDNRGTALPATASALISGTHAGLTLTPYVVNQLGSVAGLALTSVSGSPTRETAAIEYVAGALARNEYTYQKDVFIELAVETPQQILGNNTTPASIGTLLTTNPATGAGIFGVFEACGGFVTLQSAAAGTLYPNGFIQVDNTQPSNTYLTGDLHLTSADDAVHDKLWKFYDLQGMFDTNAGMGDLPMLKFNFKGNVSNPINNLVPTQVPNMGNQYVDVTPSILPSTLITSQVVPLADTFQTAVPFATLTFTLPADITGSEGVSNILTISFPSGHGVAVGDIRMVKIGGTVAESGVNAAIYNGTFVAQATSPLLMQLVLSAVPTALPTTAGAAIGNTGAIPFNFGNLSASNFFGFTYDRYMAGQLIGFTKGATPTDVSVTVLQDQSGTTNFDPDKSITQFFGLQIKWGLGTVGYNTTMIWNNLQVTQVKEGKIGKYLARDVTLRNTGNSFLIYS